jgi:HEAT repeat protein
MTRLLPLLALLALLPRTGAAAPPPALPPAPAPDLRPGTCSVEGLMDSIRTGLSRSHSEAYRRYLRTLLRESAVTLPEAELRAAFARETEPVMVEHLAAALVARTERGADAASLQDVAQRALGSADPAVRAATVRALRRTGAVEHTGDLYAKLVRDPSPEVRREAARNLVEDNRHVYAGQLGAATDAAVEAALASSDPDVTASVLAGLDTQRASGESALRLQGLLRSDSATVRAAAATALGGVPAPEMAGAREALLSAYAGESDAGVRRALLRGIAQLGFADAVPDLQRLRAVAPALAPEVDAWTRVLSMDLQEWGLILREKERQSQAR